MRCVRAVLALVALLGVAACRSDLDMRSINRDGAYSASVWETEGFALESDTRRVMLEFERPPVGHVVDSDTYIGYISVPVHPKRGFVFTEPSFGVGWSDVAMSFGGIFDPFPKPLPNGKAVAVAPDDSFVDSEFSREIKAWPAVDPRYLEYAESLRESLYNFERVDLTPVPEPNDAPEQRFVQADDD